MYCHVYPANALHSPKYVVVLSEYRGALLLSRHARRTTWETQGGHIEAGETPLDAAKRELFEESGAVCYDITYAFDYRAGDDDGYADGAVFLAQIHTLGPIPDSEMDEVRSFDTIPSDGMLTYPGITPVLYRHALKNRLLYQQKEETP